MAKIISFGHHPASPDDVCYIPFSNMISIIETPVMVASTGRYYKIKSECFQKMDVETSSIIKKLH